MPRNAHECIIATGMIAFSTVLVTIAWPVLSAVADTSDPRTPAAEPHYPPTFSPPAPPTPTTPTPTPPTPTTPTPTPTPTPTTPPPPRPKLKCGPGNPFTIDWTWHNEKNQLEGAVVVRVSDMFPGTQVVVLYKDANGTQAKRAATVDPDGKAEITIPAGDGINHLYLVGLGKDANGNPVICDNHSDISLPPTIKIRTNSSGASGANSLYSITVSGLIPGTMVRVTWAANGQAQTASAVVGPDGTATVVLPVLDPGGPTVFTVTATRTGIDGRPEEVTLIDSISVPFSTTPTPTAPADTARPTAPIPSPTSAPTAPSSGSTLHGKSSAVSKSSKLRTWVSGDPAAAMQMATIVTCRGPFKFRIQKQKITTIHTGRKSAKRVTWTTLSGKYTTNEKSGIWYYRTVNLKKGTYRSVIAGKCGIPGLTTNKVTLKK